MKTKASNAENVEQEKKIKKKIAMKEREEATAFSPTLFFSENKQLNILFQSTILHCIKFNLYLYTVRAVVRHIKIHLKSTFICRAAIAANIAFQNITIVNLAQNAIFPQIVHFMFPILHAKN